MEHAGVGVDVADLRELHARLTAEVQRLGIELQGGRRARRPQHQLADPAARDPLRRAAGRSWPDADQEDEDRRLHRCRHAREVATGMAGVHRAAVAVPRGREAARHVRRGPARRGRPGRADPRHVQPDRRPHRAAQLGPPEPPQHPGAPGGGSAVPQGVHGRAGRQAAGRRLQPDRAALHRPPRRRPRADLGVHGGRGHPQHHGGADLRCRLRRRHAGPAIEGEDGVVRVGLRDGGLRARAAPEHPDRGGGEDPRRLLRGLPEREEVHGRHGRRGPQARATPRPCSGAGGRSRSCSTATGGSARRGSARR